MRNSYILLPITISLLVLSSSCNKSEDVLFDTPYVLVEAANVSSSGPVNTDQEFVGEYHIYLNTATFSNNVVVSYEVEVGNGLVAGQDFELLTKSNSITFLPGIYDMTIRVKWLRTCVRDEDTDEIVSDTLDETKDNTLTIKLTGCSADFTLGYPGPLQLKKSITVKKIKSS